MTGAEAQLLAALLGNIETRTRPFPEWLDRLATGDDLGSDASVLASQLARVRVAASLAEECLDEQGGLR